VSRSYGRTPKTPDPRDFLLGDHLAGIDPVQAVAGATFGHGNTYANWRMNGNGPVQPGEALPAKWKAAKEGAGDCVYAAWVNEVKEALTDAGMDPAAAEAKVGNAETAIRAYMSTGYNPSTGAHDDGAEVRDRLKRAQKTGLTLADKTVHKIGMYVAVDYTNLDHLLFALKYFEGLPIGCAVLNANEEAFGEAEGKLDPEGHPLAAVWDDEPNGEVVALHCIPLVGRPDSTHIAALTWGRRVFLTPAYMAKRVEEVWAYLSADRISAVTGKSYEGASEAVLAEYIQKVVAM
jgi:hypothetical protein